jgi:hypothetical protein
MNKFIQLGIVSLALAFLSIPSFALNPQPLPPGQAVQNNQNVQQMNQKKQLLMQKRQQLQNNLKTQ